MEKSGKSKENNGVPASYRYDKEIPSDSLMLLELLKTTEIQQLFESYYNLINIPVAIIDFNANVLFSSRWQRICTQFHRVHPLTCSRCIESDTQLALQLKAGNTYNIYACLNGLTDCAAPITIEGRHVANVFIGQFMTQKPDEQRFRQQAKEFGFDVADYLAALHEVPVVPAEKIPAILDMLTRMTRLITDLAVDRKHAIEGQARQAAILDTIPQSVFWKDTQGYYLGCNAAFARAAGLAAPDDIVGKTDFDLPWPRTDAEAYRADDFAVISSNQPKLHIEESIRLADDSRIVVDTSKIPLIGTGTMPYGVVGIYEDITERKQADEKIKASEEKFRKAFMTGADAFYLATLREGRLIEANESFEDVFGYSRDEVIGKTSIELGLYVDPIDRQRWVAEIGATDQIRNLKLRVKKKGGEQIVVSLSVSLLNGRDEPLILGVAKDITAQSRAQEALRESELKYRALFDNADDAILLFADGRWVDCNAGALRIFGCTREQIIGANLHRFSPPTQPDGRSSEDLVAERINLAFSKEPQVFEWVHCRPDGTLFNADVHLNRLDLEGKPHLQAIVRDISFRKRAEDALRKSEERFQLSMEATNDGLWDWNAQTNEVYYSPAVYHMLGYAVGDFPETLKAWQDLLHPDDVGHTMQVNTDCVEGRCETFAVEYRLKAKNGEWRWILGRGKSIARDAQGRSLRLVGTNVDITERKKTEASLLASEQQFRVLVEQSIAGAFIIQADRIIYVNPRFCEILGYPRDELLLGRCWLELVAKKDRGKLKDQLQAWHGSGQRFLRPSSLRCERMARRLRSA